MRILFLIVLFAFTAFAADPPVKESGSIAEGSVLPQIVQGGAWATELQVVNTDDELRPIPYTISFFATAVRVWTYASWTATGPISA